MMRIISNKKLREFYEKYPDAENSTRTWKKLVENENWHNFAEINDNFIFKPDKVKNFVIFNIRGNKYRLIVKINYQKKKVYIRHFLTHAEYDREKWKEDEWFDSE